MSKEPKKIDTSTLEDAPIGVLDDGEINFVKKDDPPFKPKIVDDDGNEVEMGEDD